MSSTSNDPTHAPYEPRLARRAERMRASEIRELLKLLEQPDIISFAGGIPDPALFPADAAGQAFSDLLSNQAAAALQYSVSEGYGPLRNWIADHMTGLGAPCTPDNILVTAGSQQALDFLGKLLLSPGDTALVTAPTYLGALQAFSAYEPNYDHIRPEDGNETPASYKARAVAAGGPDASVKFAYVVPDFANPTGLTLDRAARERLLSLARELDIPVIEDSAYAPLRYGGADVPPLLALDIAATGSIEASRVIYCGTFSKTMAPGLRIGWIAANAALIRRLVLVKQASDLNVSVINQMVMERLVRQTYEDQVRRARSRYRARRDAMLAALEAHMPAGVSWTRPEGGLFVWVTLPEGVDGAELLRRAVAEVRVAFVPGGAFFADRSQANTIRLSFSLADEATIGEGIRRLAGLIRG
jgi:DNA-binding transcriptional MocR family regulator